MIDSLVGVSVANRTTPHRSTSSRPNAMHKVQLGGDHLGIASLLQLETPAQKMLVHIDQLSGEAQSLGW